MAYKIEISGDIFWATTKVPNKEEVDALCASQVKNILLNADQPFQLKEIFQKLCDTGKKIFLFVNEHTINLAVELTADRVFARTSSGKDLEKIDVFLSVAEASSSRKQGITRIIAVLDEATALLNAASFVSKSNRLCALTLIPNTKLPHNQTILEIALLIASACHVPTLLMTPDIDKVESLHDQQDKYGFNGIVAGRIRALK